jgi:carbamoyl-phosphate synthase / aspartate carbamoyltransferase
MKHVVTLDGWTRDQVDALMIRSKEMAEMQRSEAMTILQGRVLGLLFYEASTRTSCSFQAAMLRLGGKVISVSAESSSVKKGESLEDSVRSLGSYCDALVIRHPEHGAAARAAVALDDVCPVFNAGDGTGQHPTQALLYVHYCNSRCFY